MPSNATTLAQAPDLRYRAQLSEMMDEPCSRDELRACLRDLARLNRWFQGYRPVIEWLDSFVPSAMPQPLRIIDVGCGYGDTLRRIEQWAAQRRLAVDLTGLDINPDAVAIAAEASTSASRIQWVVADIFAYTPAQPVHLVVSSLFTHHLLEADVVRFLAWMERHASLGWFINDLSRAAIPYHFLRIFTRLVGLHRFVQNDAPVSVARAFVAEDWRRMCAEAGLVPRDFAIMEYKPGRLCVARRKPQ
jgi:SAM-dependent methyltransferase